MVGGLPANLPIEAVLVIADILLKADVASAWSLHPLVCSLRGLSVTTWNEPREDYATNGDGRAGKTAGDERCSKDGWFGFNRRFRETSRWETSR